MFASRSTTLAREELFIAATVSDKPLNTHRTQIASARRRKGGCLLPRGGYHYPGVDFRFCNGGACRSEICFTRLRSLLPAMPDITRQGQIRPGFWPARKAFVSPTDDVPRRVRDLIDQAVDEHLLSDVPVASFLSGGIDSSIVTAVAAEKLEKKLQTFSVGFDLAEFDETAIAQEIAERYRTDHHRIQLSEEEVIHSVTEAVEKLDLPSVDAINTYIVSRAVAAHGVKVALSGLGGDELFGGYPSFREFRLKIIAEYRATSEGPGSVPTRDG